MSEAVKIKTDFVPSWCDWFTAGVIYVGTRCGFGHDLAEVIDDKGVKVKVYLPESAHIDLRAWEVIE